MDVQAIKDDLIKALRAHLAPVPVVDLEVASDRDHDGDTILRLRAVYDDREGIPSGDQVFEAFGVVRDRLEARGEARFPHLTFISLSDREADAAA